MPDERDRELESLRRWRRDLHRIPELGDELPQTLAYVRGELEDLACEVWEPCPGALCAWFDLGRGRTVALRADMDALPVTERTGASWASEHPGRMHACGHDGHMAMALGAARWVDAVARGRAEVDAEALPRDVLVVFQPAEETTGGAARVCASGLFERTRADRIFGFHLWPGMPAGRLASRPGALLARSSEVTVDFAGRSSHVARWREGRDALRAATRFVGEAEDAVGALEGCGPSLLRFGRLEAGTVRNAIAGSARAEGTLRVFSDEAFSRAGDVVRRAAGEAAAAEGCEASVSLSEGYPPVVNDAALYERAEAALGGAEALGRLAEPLLIAEDFSFYQRRLPGVFLLLGTGTSAPLHSDAFDFDERVLLAGTAAYRRLITMA